MGKKNAILKEGGNKVKLLYHKLLGRTAFLKKKSYCSGKIVKIAIKMLIPGGASGMNLWEGVTLFHALQVDFI